MNEMDIRMEYWKYQEIVERQAKTRKTIDKVALQEMLLHKINTTNIYNTDKEYLADYNRQMSDLLHTLNCYGGFNNRGWIAFCTIPGWHDIIRMLQAIDTRDDTSHYWRLMDYFDSVTPGLHYYGASGFQPTAREKRIVSRLHRRYNQALGL